MIFKTIFILCLIGFSIQKPSGGPGRRNTRSYDKLAKGKATAVEGSSTEEEHPPVPTKPAKSSSEGSESERRKYNTRSYEKLTKGKTVAGSGSEEKQAPPTKPVEYSVQGSESERRKYNTRNYEKLTKDTEAPPTKPVKYSVELLWDLIRTINYKVPDDDDITMTRDTYIMYTGDTKLPIIHEKVNLELFKNRMKGSKGRDVYEKLQKQRD